MSKLRIVSLTVLAILVSATAHAAGSAGIEVGIDSASALGKGNAVVADPQDASTLVYNPAALTEIKGTQVMHNSTILVPYNKFESTRGATESATHTPIYIPSFFFTADTPIEKFKLAGGVNSPYGLSNQWSSTGSFKYTGFSNSIKSIYYTVGGAYEINPWFSVGASGSYVDTSVKQVSKLNANYFSTLFGGPPGPGDTLTEMDMRGHGFGWSMGAYAKPHAKAALGAMYRSSVKSRVRGIYSADDIQGVIMQSIFGASTFQTDVDTDITFPDSFVIGLLYKPNDKWDLELDLGWTGWKKFDRFDFTYGNPNAILNGGDPSAHTFKNTYSINFGATYHLNPKWDLMGGYAYYERAATKNDYSNDFPDSDRHNIAFGFKYHAKNWTWSTAYDAQFLPGISIDNNVGSGNNVSIDGEYSGFYNVILSSLTYDF